MHHVVHKHMKHNWFQY